MITIFEGQRNSGKTFLSREYSKTKCIPIFKFDFVGWFNRLDFKDSDKLTHNFALGKELMLLQLNKEGFLQDFVLDRGILTVLTWAITSKRITKQEAISQLDMISSQGLLENCEIVFVEGQNPNKESRNKDQWDNTETTSEESDIMKILLDHISTINKNINIKFLHNTFDTETLKELAKI